MVPSETAFAKLHSDAYLWALALCRYERDLAEETLQTSYAIAWEKRRSFRGDADLRTWLFAIIKNVVRTELRRRRLRRLLHPWSIDDREPPDNPPAGASAPGAAAIDAIDVRRALRALAGRSERQHCVITLVFFEGASLQEAAQILGVSVGTARQHYHRGKVALRQLLREVGGPDD